MCTYNMDYTHKNACTYKCTHLYHKLANYILTLNKLTFSCELINDETMEDNDDTNLEDEDNNSRMLVLNGEN